MNVPGEFSICRGENLQNSFLISPICCVKTGKLQINFIGGYICFICLESSSGVIIGDCGKSGR